MTILPVAEFMPDMPDLSDATTIATNVMPITPQSYGPVRDLYVASDNSVNAPILGMGSAADAAQVQYVFVGNDTTMNVLFGGSTTFSDVTNSGGPYAAFPENWHFAQFNNLMLATDFADPIQTYTLGTGLFTNLAAAAPKARYIAVAKNFVIVANTSDPIGGQNPARVWWSANNDPTNWPTPGSLAAQQVQSDYNDLNGPMGAISGLAPNLAGCDCAIFFERGVFRMIYAGPPTVFDFYPAASVRGTSSPNSIVSLGQMVYYFGEDGFYAFDGTTSVPIGANKVDRWFLENADLSYYTISGKIFDTAHLIIGAPDVNNKAIMWTFRMSSADLPASGIPAPTHMLIYRWDIQRWSYCELAPEWIQRTPAPNATTGTTVGLAKVTEGEFQIVAMSPAGASSPYPSYMAYFAGSYLTAEVGSKVVQINQGSRSMLTGVRPLVNSGQQYGITTQAGDPITTEGGDVISTEYYTPTITVAVSARATYQDPEIFGDEVTLDIIGNASFRADGRYHRARIKVDSGASGMWSQLAGFDIAASQSGAR